MTLSSSDLKASTRLFELGNGKFVSERTLKDLLPDVETALFFAKVYKLDYLKLSKLIELLFNSDVVNELLRGTHSTELQSYIVDTVPPEVWPQARPQFVEEPPPAEFLPELWASLEVQVAQSIQEVADKLVDVLDHLPGKAGQMTFAHLARFNKRRPTIGTFEAQVVHPPHAPNLVIFDDSGSVSEFTIRKIIGDIVAMSWKADAHLAAVSNTCRHWEPGSYSVDAVLAEGEYGGTHYETLTPLLNRNWGTVVTIADYDSSLSAKEYIRNHATGRIGQVLDISLVPRVSFLAECVGQLASTMRPLLIGQSYYF